MTSPGSGHAGLRIDLHGGPRDSDPGITRGAQFQGHALNYPLMGDSDFRVSRLYGMLPAGASGDPGQRIPAGHVTVRNVVVFGPGEEIKRPHPPRSRPAP